MDSFIYALVLSPALSELLPKSGYAKTPANVGLAGSILFALFLVGWGLSFMWGPIADRFGRTRVLAATILAYAVFTGAAALAQSVWQLALFRLLAGIGIGGEWALAGTYVAEAWPEDRRKMGAGFLQTGYYFGFFLAAALNYTVGARFGWRAMFLCGLSPVIISVLILARVKEPERWREKAGLPGPVGKPQRWAGSLAEIFSVEVSAEDDCQRGVVDGRDHRSLGGSGLRTDRNHHSCEKGWDVIGASVADSFHWNGGSFHRNDIGLFDGADSRGATGKENYAGYLFSGHERVHLVEFWMGVLFGEWPDDVYRVLIFSGIFWREFYFVHLMAPRAI